MIGYISRLSFENVLGTTKPLLSSIGQLNVHSGDVTYLTDRVTLPRLAEIAGAKLKHVEALASPRTEGPNRRLEVDWGGSTMLSRDIETRRRRIAPLALASSAHHRADWMNKLLPYCPETFELLVAKCAVCGGGLAWTSAWGIGRCESRKHDVPSSGEFLPRTLRDDYSVFAMLISRDHITRSQALAGLHPDLTAMTGHKLIETVLELGRIERQKGQKLQPHFAKSILPSVLAETICRGMSFLTGWPDRIQALAQISLKDRANKSHISRRLRTLVMEERGTASVAMYTNALPELLVDARKQSPNGPTCVMLGNELKERSGIDAGEVQRLRDAELIGAKVVHAGERTQVQFDRTLAENFLVAKRGCVDRRKASQLLGIPHYAVDQLIAAGLITLNDHPALVLLRPGSRIELKSIDIIERQLFEKAVGTRSSNQTISLISAMRVFGGALKPWGSIIASLSCQSDDTKNLVSFSIASRGGKGIIGRIKVSVTDFDEQHGDEVADPVAVNVTDTVSMMDAQDILNSTHGQIQSLAEIGALTLTKQGMSMGAKLSQVLEVANNRISAAEAGARIRHRHSRVGNMLASFGLRALSGGGYDRSAFFANQKVNRRLRA